MSETVCRWGILGTAFIAKKNWMSIRNAANSTLVAVASRDRDRSRQFIQQCQSEVPFASAPEACGSYDELLARDDVDAVYVPLPTGLRKEWVVRAANAGKHVMCEKPCGVSVPELEEMLAACRRNNVQFMDGVMFMHSDRLPAIRDVLNDGQRIGQIKRIVTQFSFCAADEWLQNNIRTTSSLEPQGCLGDLGWYCIRFSLWVMNWQMPERVSGRLLSQIRREGSAAPTPTEFSGELFFAGGVSAGFYTSFQTHQQQWANVSGTKGYLLVPDFVLPYFNSEVSFDVTNDHFHVEGSCGFNLENHTRRVAVPEYSNSAANAQETKLFRHFANLVLSGRPDPFWGRISLQTQQVMDACARSATSDGQIVELGT